MVKKDLTNAPLEEILYECAILRSVGSLPHRTLHEFDGFVQSCLFGELKGKYTERAHEMEGWREQPLRNWALLFHEYCLEEYQGD